FFLGGKKKKKKKKKKGDYIHIRTHIVYYIHVYIFIFFWYDFQCIGVNVVIVWYRGNAVVWASFQLGIIVLSQTLSSYYVGRVKTYRLKSVRRLNLDFKEGEEDEIEEERSEERRETQEALETAAELNKEQKQDGETDNDDAKSIDDMGDSGKLLTIAEDGNAENDASAGVNSEEADTEVPEGDAQEEEKEIDDDEEESEHSVNEAPKQLSYRENRCAHQLLVLLGIGRAFYGLKSIKRMHKDGAKIDTEYYLLKLW
ncbi:hypothetical protein RFI_12082, partial [Reticulomyxa filosa]